MPSFLEFDARVYGIILVAAWFCLLLFRTANRLKAKRAVIREWDSWVVRNPEEAKLMGGMRFYRYLQQERPDLLNFRVGYTDRFDKGLVVHQWLLSEGRVKD